jgi:hypothetical protein
VTWLEAKGAGLCPRCAARGLEVPCCETSVLCDRHAADNAERQARYAARVRPERRAKKRCAFCGERSMFYRCASCALQLKAWRSGTLLGEGA